MYTGLKFPRTAQQNMASQNKERRHPNLPKRPSSGEGYNSPLDEVSENEAKNDRNKDHICKVKQNQIKSQERNKNKTDKRTANCIRKRWLATMIVIAFVIIGLVVVIVVQNIEKPSLNPKRKPIEVPNSFHSRKLCLVPSTMKNSSQEQGQMFVLLFPENIKLAEFANKTAYLASKSSFHLGITSFDPENITASHIYDYHSNMKQTKLIIPKSYILSSLKLEPKGILLKTSDASSLLLFDENTISTGSSLVFPLRKLSNSYIISTSTPFDDSLDSAAQFAIAATKDDTQVSITFKMDVDRKFEYDGRTYQNGDVMHLTMHRLRTFQVVHKVDLTGTTINASYPVAVFSGNKCNRLGYLGTCSKLIEQIPPINRLDNSFIVSPTVERLGLQIRMVSPFNNNIRYRVGKISTTTTVEEKGFHDFIVKSNEVGVIESQNKLLVTSFSIPTDSNEGDPYMITIPGIHQYLNNYLVVIPEGFDNNYISIMIPSSSFQNLRINGTKVNEIYKVFDSTVGLQENTYSVNVMKIKPGVLGIRTVDRVPFGLLVYGHRMNDGHGFAGNVLLPDHCL